MLAVHDSAQPALVACRDIGRGATVDLMRPAVFATSLAAPPRPRRAVAWRSWGSLLFCVALVTAANLSFVPILVGHNDLGWHLAAGDLIRASGSIPTTDPWAFTSAGKPWLNLSWAWDAGASALFSATGLRGLALATLCFGAALVAGLWLMAVQAGASPVAATIAAGAAGLLLPTFALPDVFLTASPNMATTGFCVLFLGVCQSRRALWLLPFAMLTWVNLHGGFTLGLAVVGLFAATSLARRDRNGLLLFGCVGLGCFAATLVNPLGYDVYAGVSATLGHFVQEHISEWMPYLRVVSWRQALPTLIYAGLFVTLERVRSRPAPVEARLLSWAFLVLGFLQLRFLSLFILVSVVPVAVHLGDRLGSRAAERVMAVAGLVVAGCLPWLAASAAFPARFPGIDPVREIEFLLEQRPQARLLNHWNYGSSLIFHTRGQIPVFVDGRAATAYPDDLLRDYFPLSVETIDETAWLTVLAKYRIDTVLWVKAHGALQDFLTGRQGWRLAYSGDIANVYVREP
jgi:hypothetical protein